MLRSDSNSRGPLPKLAGADDGTSFANKLVISRFLKPIYAELVEYDKSVASIGQKYGRPSPDHGGQLVVTGESIAPYQRELSELNAVAVEISASPLTDSVVEKVGLTPSDILLLEDFLEIRS